MVLRCPPFRTTTLQLSPIGRSLTYSLSLASLSAQSTSRIEVFSGVNFAYKVQVSPSTRMRSVTEERTSILEGKMCSTVISVVVERSGLVVVSVMLAVPTPTAVTIPLASTFKILSSLLDHVASGSTLVITGSVDICSCKVSPTASVVFAASMPIPVASTNLAVVRELYSLLCVYPLGWRAVVFTQPSLSIDTANKTQRTGSVVPLINPLGTMVSCEIISTLASSGSVTEIVSG